MAQPIISLPFRTVDELIAALESIKSVLPAGSLLDPRFDSKVQLSGVSGTKNVYVIDIRFS